MLGNRQYKFRTIVSEVSSFLGNLCKSLLICDGEKIHIVYSGKFVLNVIINKKLEIYCFLLNCLGIARIFFSAYARTFGPTPTRYMV